MQRRTSSIVNIVKGHTFDSHKVEQGGRLVSLRSDMKHMSSINVPQIDIGSHFITNNLDQLEISVVSCKVQCCELFVSYLIRPNLQSFWHGLFVFV